MHFNKSHTPKTHDLNHADVSADRQALWTQGVCGSLMPTFPSDSPVPSAVHPRIPKSLPRSVPALFCFFFFLSFFLSRLPVFCRREEKKRSRHFSVLSAGSDECGPATGRGGVCVVSIIKVAGGAGEKFIWRETQVSGEHFVWCKVSRD